MNDGIYVHTRVVGGSLEREELIFICGWRQHYDRDLDRSSRLKLESPRFLESREALLLLFSFNSTSLFESKSSDR